MLKNLETKVREQDQYWSKVVLMKDNEIDVLKGTVASSWACELDPQRIRDSHSLTSFSNSNLAGIVYKSISTP